MLELAPSASQDTVDQFAEIVDGYTAYTDTGELTATLENGDLVDCTITIISTATIIFSCLC
jgi:hypothetical protein